MSELITAAADPMADYHSEPWRLWTPVPGHTIFGDHPGCSAVLAWVADDTQANRQAFVDFRKGFAGTTPFVLVLRGDRGLSLFVGWSELLTTLSLTRAGQVLVRAHRQIGAGHLPDARLRESLRHQGHRTWTCDMRCWRPAEPADACAVAIGLVEALLLTAADNRPMVGEPLSGLARRLARRKTRRA